jgi:perosamine synthetase
MHDFQNKISEIFYRYKCKNKYDELHSIPIFNSVNNIYAYLVPLTFQYNIVSPKWISLFSKWRDENQIGFANSFRITDERTEYWVNNLLLNRKDRILFMIKDLQNLEIGHLGFSSFNFHEKNCEIDNVIRGVKGVYPGIMKQAIESLIIWGKDKLGLKKISLKVLEDNTHAVDFYKKLNFNEIKRIPLYKIEDKTEVKWIELPEKSHLNPDRYYSYMELDEANIKKR